MVQNDQYSLIFHIPFRAGKLRSSSVKLINCKYAIFGVIYKYCLHSMSVLGACVLGYSL